MTTVSSASSSPLVVNGLVSGINTSAVISALLASYQQPITDLQNQQSTLNATASDYQALVADMQAVSTAAQALATKSQWDLMTAASSNSSVATASASPGAQPGSLTFQVNNLAQANVLLSEGASSSLGSVVTTAPSFLVATGAAALGFTSLGSNGLALGSHSIAVTQASQSASLEGTALPSSTLITSGVNDTLNLTVNGGNYTLSIAGGTYTPTQLVSALNSAITNAAAPISASVNAAGEISISTDEQGSAATLAVTGGDGASSLGLTNSSAGGTDAIVNVDGTTTTLTSIVANQSVVLNASTGSINATVASAPSPGGSFLSTGTAAAAEVSSGTGTLSSVIQSINNSGLNISASAIEPTSGQYRLQVGANATGLAGSVTIDPGAFGSGQLVGMSTIANAEDASVTVGGAGGYTLTSSTDTFSSLIGGAAITVAAAGSATVTVTPDASASAAKVASLVSAANQALSDINNLTAYNTATKTGGPLMGSSAVASLRQQILSIFATSEGTSNVGNSQNVGISVESDGSLTFNQASFEKAFSANPNEVSALFTQGGVFSPSSPSYGGQVSLTFAGNTTQTGTYDVSISQSAAQAVDSGSVLSTGSVSVAENLAVSSGGVTANYSTVNGESLGAIATGLNNAFASNGLDLTASVTGSGQQLQITSIGYGSTASFTVTSNASGAGTTGLGGSTSGTPATFSGVDVAGTINNVAATGMGQVLSAPQNDPMLNGLSLTVLTPGVSSSTDLGTYAYEPGIAQQLSTLATEMTTSGTGALSSEVSGLQSEATGLNGQITNYQQIETSQQSLLQNEFAQMEATLGSLKNESSALTGQLSGIAATPW